MALDTKDTYLHKELFDEADVEIELVGQSKWLQNREKLCEAIPPRADSSHEYKETAVPSIVSIDRVERVDL